MRNFLYKIIIINIKFKHQSHDPRVFGVVTKEVELINIERTSLDGFADLEDIGRCDIVLRYPVRNFIYKYI